MSAKRFIFPFLLLASTALVTSPVNGTLNLNGKWAMHFAGAHAPQTNTCDLDSVYPCPEVRALVTEGRYDVYVLAMETDEITQTSFGITCTGDFAFNGWTSCADTQVPTAGWPECDEGITLTWASAQTGQQVVLGILDIQVYGLSRLMASPHPTANHGEWCDGTLPTAECVQITNPGHFGYVGFAGLVGFNPLQAPCGSVPVERTTWGAIKALYQN